MSVQSSNPVDRSGPKPPRSDRNAQRRNRWIRWSVLSVVLVGVTVLGYLHQASGIVKPVGVDALCPFGGLETMWKLVSEGGTLQRIALSSVVLFVAMTGMALVFRRAFCGYICPLGFLQELFGKLGQLFTKGRRLQMPAVLDRYARYLKYAVLVFFIAWTWQAAELVLRPYDPWVAWMHLSSAELFAEFGIGAAVLGISLAGSVLYDRFFCKYLCPTGAFLGIVSKVAPFAVTRNENTCIDCGACDKACPANITVSALDRVTTAECLSCNECTNACPVADTLVVSTKPKAGAARGFAPSAGTLMGIVLGVFVAVIAVTTITGSFVWQIKPLEAPKGGEAINVEEIRGRMSFHEISVATGIPEEAFRERFGVSESEMEAPIKDLAATYGFDVHTDVRQFVADKAAEGTVAP